MSIKDQLLLDFKESMKAHDEVRKNTINLARAAVKQYEVDNRKELDDQGIIEILTKQVKMRKDALSDFEKAGRTDLVESYNKEIKVLMEYLPAQLTQAEISEIIKQTAADLNIEGGRQNFGKLIGAVMGKVKGRADGGDVKKQIEDFLK
ncbi:GatB/YqeY domain-containing protein [Anaerovorax sp. IOR16]|uniref:GatB/YqeY domain-containing protein n=1 Tax=Anaerovorax sp. IOR16 TaxID=2773458 RepID=UPI0019D1B8BC|nr:GatB/YqeY domain-containing protein [Anaerovorax sp. IOR16]